MIFEEPTDASMARLGGTKVAPNRWLPDMVMNSQ